jgi:hypothetical protein
MGKVQNPINCRLYKPSSEPFRIQLYVDVSSPEDMEIRNIKTAKRSCENVVQCIYLKTTVTNQNLIQKEIERRLDLGNACYHSVQKLLSSPLLSTNVKIRIHNTIVLPVVLYGHETWSLALREEHRLRVFENRLLRILGQNSTMRSFITCRLSQVQLE